MSDDFQPRGFYRHLLGHPLAVACLAYLGALIVVAIVAPIVLPGVAGTRSGDLAAIRQGPTGAHLLGTDSLGRDVLERLLVGTRVTLLGVAQAVVVVVALGVPLGLLAGYFGGRTDRVVTWLADVTFAMPAIVMILVVLALFPQSMTAAMLTLGVIAAPGLMRVTRSATLPVREELYIAAAQVAGLSRTYIISRHVLPRVAGPVVVQVSLVAASALLVQTGLAFLGLVVAEPAPSWGGMVADGFQAITEEPWLIWPPGLAIAFTVLALGLLGDLVRDAGTERWAPSARRPRRRRSATRRSAGAAALDQPAPAGRPVPRPAPEALLSIEGLTVAFDTPAGARKVVEDVWLAIGAGETVGVVGESGSGKTVTATAIIGLLPGMGRIERGRVVFDGADLALATERGMREIRGKGIGLISQEPMVALNPAYRVGWQLTEVVRRHRGLARRAARERALDLLREVQLPDPESVFRRYPHELSGGMAQRVAIARALAGEPKLLIADEPTTALDVTVQAEILELLRRLQAERGMAIMFVTHDWGVVADMCDRAVVMYAGQVVEEGEVTALFHAARHPYTKALLDSNPHAAVDQELLPVISGAVPKPGQWPAGCHFHPRCPLATDACRAHPIPLEQPAPGRWSRCIHHQRLAAAQEGAAA
ncbi:dipeptide/oligopeptide/nickel ABC transporter permease/ATP-binding protein [Conexibacter woesei]|uniref:Oligopeptide/dipeptide ABC transporter, ATPase subunit n=1 Tax=Conexibacter woesei (strain DSM 14684 / CCUG 47730 / CIP 108061 / JCM 11494 / NBRC 100937 / ID131577) TaxID=469383 RepID=D3F378_CONWI|nr:dipeptide/oligopeptide/nickel ABC transporter permease/ATP-binding protein [Conexibacter woesei]ADB50358.1 oligopeptide/dipeptide ABC transporter, ATPase subunit [Conexibacter woesei DSM 14684]